MDIVQTITGPIEGETFTARSFLEYMRRSSEHWWTHEEYECRWVFRGHAGANWRLIPSAARPSGKFEELISELSRIFGMEFSEWASVEEVIKSQILSVLAQHLCIEQFSRLSDDVGFPTYPSLKFSTIMKIIRGELKIMPSLECALDQLERTTINSETSENQFVQSASMAQHHGIPTFFLDWTDSPITACYFAAKDAQSDIAVWALNERLIDVDMFHHLGDLFADETDRFGGLVFLRLFRPKKTDNKYLAAQSGLMSYLKTPVNPWRQRGRYPALEEMAREFDIDFLKSKIGDIKNHELRDLYRCNLDKLESEPLLRKVVLPYEQVPVLRSLLYREGMSIAHLMPTLDNVATTAIDFVATKLAGSDSI